jgi:rhodanese-related sulfurtransferase
MVSPVDAYGEALKGNISIIDIRPNRERVRDGRILHAYTAEFEAAPESYTAFAEAVFLLTKGDTTRPIALLCRHGIHAQEARRVLIEHGMSRVSVVAGGFLGSESDPGWQLWGLPVQRD